MSVDTQYVLPNDILMIHPSLVSSEIQEKLNLPNGSMLLTRKGSRERTRVLDANTAALLSQFRGGSSIVDAIREISTTTKEDLEKTLEEAYPLLSQLVQLGWLVDTNAPGASSLKYTLQIGDKVGEFEVIRLIQLLEDTEVYQVCTEAGDRGALKLVRGSQQRARKGLTREARLLSFLNGTPTPSLLGEGLIEGSPFIVLSWIDGMLASDAAAQLRRLPVGSRVTAFITLASAILKSYASLHDRNVVHSDIHPSNIIIDSSGTAHIIDLSYSERYVGSEATEHAPRAVIAYFKDPQHAAASISDTERPLATASSDQYSLGALLFFLLTGQHYLDFSLDKDEQLEQIVSIPPRSLHAVGLRGYEPLEQVFSRMLHKDPANRFVSLHECLRALQAVVPTEDATPPTLTPPLVGELCGQCHMFERLGRVNSCEVLCEAPTASANYGAAGIAYAFLRRSVNEHSAEMLNQADRWALTAHKELAYDRGLEAPTLQITPETIGELSLYHGEAGIHLMQALVAWAMGDIVSENESVGRFVQTTYTPGDSLDFTLGKAGLLHGCSKLRAIRPTDNSVIAAGDSLASQLTSAIVDLPEIRMQSAISFLGFAHGWAGILFALLGWRDAGGTVDDLHIKDRLNELAALAQPNRLGSSWPRKIKAGSSAHTDTDNPSWCNGSAGFVWLWCKAYSTYRTDLYLNLAESSGYHAFHHPDAIPNLCCGKGGRAYAMVELWRATQRPEWLDRAYALTTEALEGNMYGSFSPESLIKGRLGVELLAYELQSPHTAQLPLL